LSCLVRGKRSRRAYGNNDIHPSLSHQFPRDGRERIDISGCVPKLEANIAAFYVAKLAQKPAGSVNLRLNIHRGELDDARRPCRLLRTCRQRPRYRSANKSNELASSHITSWKALRAIAEL
jgi:hypothetical protein